MPLSVGIEKIGENQLEAPKEDLQSIDATSEMGLIIYKEIFTLFNSPFDEAIKAAQDDESKKRAADILKEAKSGWWKLSYAIAKGVIDHIKSNMEIKGIETVKSVQINGLTELPQQNIHRHPIVAESVDGKLEFTTKDYSAIDGHVE